MAKIPFYGIIKNEIGVIMVFCKIHSKLGFPQLIPSASHGFDIDSIEYNGHKVTVEFEYESGNFLIHGHPKNMKKGGKYVVVCWEDTCGLANELQKKYNKTLYDVIPLKKYIEIKEPVTSDKKDDPEHLILAYNKKESGERDFSAWELSHCFRVKKRLFPKIPEDSKVLFMEKGRIIGGFTVVRYEILHPRGNREKELYIKLTNDPCSLFTLEKDDLRDLREGHIFYKDFFVSSTRIKPNVGKVMQQGGKLKITKNQYDRICDRIGRIG
ncbi:MAG: hypothetical protein WC980_00515 [Candidatus Brocadiia bacterium]